MQRAAKDLQEVKSLGARSQGLQGCGCSQSQGLVWVWTRSAFGAVPAPFAAACASPAPCQQRHRSFRLAERQPARDGACLIQQVINS